MSPPKTEQFSELTTIIIAVLSSSLMSAALTKFFDFRIQNATYKKEYYKKIIDKRMEAYEKLSELIFREHIFYNDASGAPYHKFFSSWTTIFHFYTETQSLGNLQVWFSPSLKQNFQALLADLTKLKINHQIDTNIQSSELRKIAINNFQNIETRLNVIKALMDIDFFDLHNVKSFLTKRMLNNSDYFMELPDPIK